MVDDWDKRISIHAPTNGATPVVGAGCVVFKFQSTLRRTERQIDSMHYNSYSPFQSTLRRTERLPPWVQTYLYCHFNPRSDERSDRISQLPDRATGYFNPRSDERSDDTPDTEPDGGWDFNPRSDERSDDTQLIIYRADVISIHAPTNGATNSHIKEVLLFMHFNPRSDERSDQYRTDRYKHRCKISIHAPTNGATVYVIGVCVGNGISIHAPTNGATPLSYYLTLVGMYFNPRSDERSDYAHTLLDCLFYNFNPRSDERSDDTMVIYTMC